MTNRFVIILAVLALVALLCGIIAIPHARADEQTKKPVDFVLKDIAGKTVKLSDYRGKVVVVDFWATWCPYCVEEIPWLVQLQADAIKNKTPLQLIGISVDTDKDAAKDYAKKHQMNYPVLFAEDAQLKPFGDIAGYPTKFIINKNGVIVDSIVGAMERKDLEAKLAKYLK